MRGGGGLTWWALIIIAELTGTRLIRGLEGALTVGVTLFVVADGEGFFDADDGEGVLGSADALHWSHGVSACRYSKHVPSFSL